MLLINNFTIKIVVFMFVIVAASLYVLNLPVLYNELQQVCDTCSLTPEVSKQLGSIGWNNSGYALFFLVLSFSFTLGCAFLGVWILNKRSNDPIAVLVSLTLIATGFSVTITESFYTAWPSLSFIAKGISFIAILLLGVMFCYFPDFRKATRWSHYLVSAYFVVEVAGHFIPTTILPETLYRAIEWILVILMGWSQIYRYRHTSTPIQKQQTKYPAFAFLMMILLIMIAVFIPSDSLLGNMLGQSLYFFALSLLPISFTLAVTRYKLWTIDPIINRTILYGSLTTILFIIYGSVVYTLGRTFQGESSSYVSLLGTVAVVVLVQPIHHKLQKLINRLMYGDREDPYKALARLGVRLEATSTPELVLTAIVTSVREALRLPYVSLMWPDSEVVASSGVPQNNCESLDILYQGGKIAELVFAARDQDDYWTAADRRILNDLARQAGSALHAVRLTNELQRSRQKLVTAREDERIRLRRDLHDGLGPEIAAFSFRIAEARHHIQREPAKSDMILAELQNDIKNAVDLIRQIAHNLRPPVLDEFGLSAAVQELVRINKTYGMAITLEIPSPLPILEAAVEVAAYRTVQEGLTNIMRHSKATEVRIMLDLKDGILILKLEDNGIGIPDVLQFGVGLISMRERAEELGGSFKIERREPTGTILYSELPNNHGGVRNDTITSAVS